MQKRLGLRKSVGLMALIALVALAVTATTGFAKGKPDKICQDFGDWVYDGQGGWTLTGPNDLGSKKFDVNGDLNTLYVSAPSGYLISGYCVKAGNDSVFVPVNPAQASIYLVTEDLQNKDISHFSLQFVKETREDGEWCSPGFWRNNYDKHDGSAWPEPADDYANTMYSTINGPAFKSGAPADATLIDVLRNPNTYGGAAFNYVATYLSMEAGLDVQFDENGNPIHNCTLDQQGNSN